MGLQNIEGTLTRSAQDSEGLKNEVDNLSKALENAKADHAAALEELEELYQKFDEAKEQAERAGRDAATQEIRAVVAAERKNEVSKLKKEIEELMQTNSNIRKRLDEAEMSVAAAHDSGKQVDDEKSETVRRLQDQLDRTKDELGKKDEDIKELKDVMETRMTKAEKDVARLEKELSVTKGKLYEAEATLIVSKRDKARSGQMITQAIPQRSRSKDGPRVIDNAEELGSQSDALSRRLQDSGRRSRSKSPTTPQRWQFRIEEEKRNADELRKQLDELKEQNRMSESHQRRLEEDLRTLQKQLFAGEGDAPVATQMSRISQLAAQRSGDFFGEDGASSVEDIIETNDPAKMAEELRSLHKKNADQRDYNAQLLSKILSLQGNIQVCCRVRPLRMKEIQAGNTTSVEALGEAEVGCHDERNSKWKSFAFDKVWGPDQTQQSIFQDVEPLALSVVDGYNACIFAYGQTGSGKTYTMEGVEENNNYGISYRTIQKIFTLLNFRYQQQRAATAVGTASKEFSFKLQLGMLEIYNDEIFDLLADHAQAGSKADQKREAKKAGVKATLDIRRSEDGHIEVPGLTKEPVGSIKEVMALLKRGNANRATASTNLNEHSSRSHMVLSVEVESGLEGEPANKGTLYLVDLAGSERVRKSKVEGEQLKEATFINKSLSALGNVMEALDRKASHVPYRDSKLTYLLQDALGGNSRTMMVVTVCPMDTAYDESVHALQFATRVRRIQIGAAQRNVTSKNLEETVKSLTAEMKALSMAKEKSENQLSSLKRDNTRIQERLQTISSQRSKTQSDHKTLEVLRKNNSEMAARWNKEKALRERQSEELQKLKDELQKIQNELNKLAREKEGLQRQLEEKENQLSKAAEDVRVAKDASSAANLRARKAQIIGSRHTASRPSLSTPSRTPPRTPPTTTSKSAKDTNVDIEEVRQEVLALLEKYDQAKVDRIDIIMDKFKGKESLLVEKMKQRYEGGGVTTPSGASQSLQRRSELALQRHKERMQKRLEQQNTG
jgi:kinesin family protein C2/C3